MASYFSCQLRAREAEDTSTDLQVEFLPQSNGAERDPNKPKGLPIGFDPVQERGPSL